MNKEQSKTAAEWAKEYKTRERISHIEPDKLLEQTIQSAMDQARSEEREACAKECEARTTWYEPSEKSIAIDCAQLIRQRGKTL